MALNLEFDLSGLVRKTNPKFYPLFKDRSRFLVMFGSAGSGKSIFIIDKLIYRILTESSASDGIRHTFVVARAVQNTLMHSVWADFVGRLRDWGLYEYVDINKSLMEMNFPDFNRSKIIFKGLDDPEKLKSLNVTGVWIEEATDVSESSFRQLNARLRVKSEYYQTILSFNPDDDQHWIKTRFFDDSGMMSSDPATYNCVHSTYEDNIFIDQPVYEATLLEMGKGDPMWLKRFKDGKWARRSTGAEFYHGYSEERNELVDIHYNVHSPLHLSFDFNVMPYMSCVIFQIEYDDDSGKKIVKVVDEICPEPPKALTEEVCRIFKLKYASHRAGVFIYGDSTSLKRNTIDEKNDFDIIMRELVQFNPVKKVRTNINVHMRGQWINKILSGNDTVEFVLNPKICRRTRADFIYVKLNEDGGKMKEYVRDENTKQKYQPYGHTSDAVDYFLTSAFRNEFDKFQMGRRIRPILIKEKTNDVWF